MGTGINDTLCVGGSGNNRSAALIIDAARNKKSAGFPRDVNGAADANAFNFSCDLYIHITNKKINDENITFE